jgi:hypothetical protein|tara:strand:+ start:76 stop:345 length:270 start_codon:yes stop_codon:yes gene_type:complete
MKNYLYKVIIAAVALIFVFELTIGRKFSQIDDLTQNFISKEGRKEMINSIKIEMEKATKKENYLTEDERLLINNFILKIKKELNSSTSN